MTGVLAWLTLTGWAATALLGRRAGRHLRWMRAQAADHRRHTAATEGAWRAELAALRAHRTATQPARDGRAARNADRARDLRPWAQPLGDTHVH